MPSFSHNVYTDTLVPPVLAPISQQRDALVAVHEEIKALEAYFEATRTSLKAIESSLEERLERLVFPILQLPHDIISAIFILCLPRRRFLKPSVASAPLVLTRVNREFRHIAHSIPYLWSSLVWVLNSSESDGLSLQWVSHASTLELSIAFKASIPNPVLPSGQHFANIMSRIRHLALEDTIPAFLCEEIIGKCPNHSIFRGLHFREDCSLRQLVSDMPQLWELQLIPVDKYNWRDLPDLPKNLTSFRIEGDPSMPTSALWTILTSCPHLVHLHVGEVDDSYGPGGPWVNTAHTFPRLRTPYIECWMGSYGHFLASLLAPNLVSLTVENLYTADIFSLLQRSSKLRALYCMVNSELTPEILERIPDVEFLGLKSDRFIYMHQFLYNMTRNPALLPHLNTLRLNPGDDPYYFTGEPDWPEEMHHWEMIDLWAVLNLIQTRPMLRSVHVHNVENPKGFLEAQFRQLVAQGLDFALPDRKNGSSSWERKALGGGE
uniref:F-box domain-containing protein n=1 Tax=Mycena chlorophos TaxID=658473 RepID=A0ABQ0M8P3_MYCCL|nr:predicted protein [Mycena chlorophos]